MSLRAIDQIVGEPGEALLTEMDVHLRCDHAGRVARRGLCLASDESSGSGEEAPGMRRVSRISGPSSYRLSLLVRVLLPVFLVLLFSMGAMATVTRPAKPTDAYFRAYFVVVALLTVEAIIFGVVAVITRVQMGREQSHGYTWSQGYSNLALVDPVTMVVIREPGEKDLSKQERAARVAAAREWALQHPEVT